jgi:hypothetical protein
MIITAAITDAIYKHLEASSKLYCCSPLRSLHLRVIYLASNFAVFDLEFHQTEE